MGGGRARLRIPLLEGGLTLGQGLFADDGRSLTPDERKLLLTIFGSSVNLDSVQIAITDLGSAGRPYTFGNTIRVPRGTSFDAPTLVHEMTHVWQYQTRGTAYLSDSAVHQLMQGQKAYNVTLVDGQSFYDYTAEQEAMIVQKYYEDSLSGWRQNPNVVRMIGEIRKALPLSSTEIQHETWFGPNSDIPSNGSSGNDPARTVPLFRIEF